MKSAGRDEPAEFFSIYGTGTSSLFHPRCDYRE